MRVSADWWESTRERSPRVSPPETRRHEQRFGSATGQGLRRRDWWASTADPSPPPTRQATPMPLRRPVKAGGLVGENQTSGTITAAYSTGRVTKAVDSTPNLGGLVGHNPGIVANSYWDTTTSGVTSSAAGTSKTHRPTPGADGIHRHLLQLEPERGRRNRQRRPLGLSARPPSTPYWSTARYCPSPSSAQWRSLPAAPAAPTLASGNARLGVAWAAPPTTDSQSSTTTCATPRTAARTGPRTTSPPLRTPTNGLGNQFSINASQARRWTWAQSACRALR